MRTSRPYMYPSLLRQRLAGTGDIGLFPRSRMGIVGVQIALYAHKFLYKSETSRRYF